jgi:hypothetical protein
MKLYKDPMLFTDIQNHTTVSNMSTTNADYRSAVHIRLGCFLVQLAQLSLSTYSTKQLMGKVCVTYDLVECAIPVLYRKD